MESQGEQSGMMHIGAVAEHTGLSLRTLRHYDDVGLIVPSGRTAGGFRLYSERDVEKILLMRRMKPLDFSLADMKTLLELTEAARAGTISDEQRRELDELAAAARERRAQLEKKLAMANEFVERLTAELEGRAPRGV